MTIPCLFLTICLVAQSNRSTSEAEYLVETTLRISSTGGGVVRASAPIPREWSEQRIIAGSPEATRCKAKIESLSPGAAALVVSTSSLRPGEVASVVYRQRLFVKPQPRRRSEDFPRLPKLDAKSKAYAVPTPSIDSQDSAIKAKA